MQIVAIVSVLPILAEPRLDYPDQANRLSLFLTTFENISADVIDLPLLVDHYAAVIFLTRFMLAEAREVKKRNPDKPVVVISGLIDPGDDRGGIILLEKELGWIEAAARIAAVLRD